MSTVLSVQLPLNPSVLLGIYSREISCHPSPGGASRQSPFTTNCCPACVSQNCQIYAASEWVSCYAITVSLFTCFYRVIILGYIFNLVGFKTFRQIN